MKSIISKNSLGFILGSVLVIMGVTLLLNWWQDIVHLFRAAIALLLVLGGLIVLYSIKR